MVTTIRKGYRLHFNNAVWTVLGNHKIRANYFYIIEDVHHNRRSLRRTELLDAQAKGLLTVTS